MAKRTAVSSKMISMLPNSWIPYTELMRLDRPAGFYAYYVPYLIGLGYGACLADALPPPISLLQLSLLFMLYCVILRGIACSWNDNVDQDFDRQVTRTKDRPIARGAVSTTQGHVFTLCLILSQVPFLVLLPLSCTYHAIATNVVFCTYALMKRVTHYPQVVLGFPFAWAIPMSCAALGVQSLENDRMIPTLSLLVANVCWTVIYDTIYAHQDLQDDVKAGVKSMAVRFAKSTKEVATALSVIQVVLLAVVGVRLDLSPLYFCFACGGTLITQASMIATVDLEKPSSCAAFFRDTFWYVGGSVILGFASEYAARVYQFDTDVLTDVYRWI